MNNCGNCGAYNSRQIYNKFGFVVGCYLSSPCRTATGNSQDHDFWLPVKESVSTEGKDNYNPYHMEIVHILSRINHEDLKLFKKLEQLALTEGEKRGIEKAIKEIEGIKLDCQKDFGCDHSNNDQNCRDCVKEELIRKLRGEK